MNLSDSHVSITLNDDQRLVLQLGDEAHYGDTYFLGLDPQNADSEMPVVSGVKHLLQSWIQTLTAAPDNSLCHLPFDFADEFTRWIACQSSGSQLSVVVGWAPVEGWTISPRDISACATTLHSFQPDEPLMVKAFYRPRFLSQLRASLARLQPPELMKPGT